MSMITVSGDNRSITEGVITFAGAVLNRKAKVSYGITSGTSYPYERALALCLPSRVETVTSLLIHIVDRQESHHIFQIQ